MTTDEPLFLSQSEFVRLLTSEQAKSLVIVKRNEVALSTYTRCTKCKSAAQLRMTLYRIGEDAALGAHCDQCNRECAWRCLGWADPSWQPESSSARPRDTYRKATYDWEDEFFKSHGRMTDQKIRYLLAAVFTPHKQYAPKLGYVKGNTSFAHGGSLIELTKRHSKPYIVLHEAAHIFLARHNILHPEAKLEAHHGSMWLTTYLHLVSTHLDYSYEWLALSAMTARLKPLPQEHATMLIKLTEGYK